MLQKVIRYGGLALVIVGIILVMKNLFKNDSEWSNVKNKTSKGVYYSVSVSLLDSETYEFISGADLKVTDSDGFTVSEWTTDNNARLITNLENGTYKLEEVNASEGYSASDSIEFEIKGKDSEVIMKNTKGGTTSASTTTTASSGSSSSNSSSNSTSNNGSKNGSEVGVESTASFKSLFAFIVGVYILNIGFMYLYKKVK